MRAKINCGVVASSVLAWMLFIASSSCVAAEHATSLTGHDDPVQLPAIGRVVLGFVVTVALAIGVVYALRRWLPKFANRGGATSPLNVTSQSLVRNGMRFHVVTVADQTVLVAEGKTGIAMTMLPAEIKKSTEAQNS
jgi:flagellar biogenesis protein FliO